MIYDYLINFLSYVSIYIIIVLSFNLSAGFSGLVNLGHLVFFGLGAYSSAIMTLSGVPWYFALVLSALIACLAGTVIAAVTVRLKGDYFQIATLGLIFMAIALSRNWVTLTRGALGIPGIPDIMKNNLHYLIFLATISAASVCFFSLFTKSQTGKILQAIRDDEVAASILGKNTYFYKVLSISVSTFFAGLAGGLFVHHINFVDPTIFDLDFFVIILSMLLIGGMASIGGSVLSVIILSVAIESLRFVTINPEIVGALRQMLLMAVLILILIFRPKGILGKVDI